MIPYIPHEHGIYKPLYGVKETENGEVVVAMNPELIVYIEIHKDGTPLAKLVTGDVFEVRDSLDFLKIKE